MIRNYRVNITQVPLFFKTKTLNKAKIFYRKILYLDMVKIYFIKNND